MTIAASTTTGTHDGAVKTRTRAARRARAEADLRACDAEARAAEALAEAQHAEQQAAQQQALLRMAELSARLDAIPRYEEHERQPTFEEFFAARDRQEATMARLRALADEPLPHVPMTREEQRELLAELDAALAASEHEDGLFYHGGRLWDRSRFY